MSLLSSRRDRKRRALQSLVNRSPWDPTCPRCAGHVEIDEQAIKPGVHWIIRFCEVCSYRAVLHVPTSW